PSSACTAMSRSLPTVGSTTASRIASAGRYGSESTSSRAPPLTSKGRTRGERSMMRLLGAMRLITAWQTPTHSLPWPKSVSNTIGPAAAICKILRRSVCEEHRRAVALHADVEAQGVVLASRDERLPVGVGERPVHGIVPVRLVGKVDPRQLVAQQAAREHEDIQAGGLARPRARLPDRERETALCVGAAAAPAAPVPDLDHAVGDRDPLAVEQPADQLERLAVRSRRELIVVTAAEPDLVVRADCLR